MPGGRTLAVRYVPTTILTRAGGVDGNLVTPVNLGDVILLSVAVIIPPGHSGQTSIRIALAGQPIVPWDNLAAPIVGDNDRLDFDVNLQVGAGLTVVTTNVGAFDHRHFLRWKVTDLPDAGSSSGPVNLLPLAALN